MMNHHTIEILDTNKILYLPTQLAFCDAQQFIDMAQLILLYQTNVLTYEEMRVQAVYKLLNMQPINSILKQEQYNKMSNIYQLSELIDSFFDIDEATGQKSIKLNFLHNPIYEYKPFFRTYYGPDQLFQNITYGEYTDALRMFNEFIVNPSDELLIAFVSVLYKPKNRFLFFRRLFGFSQDTDRIEHTKYNIQKIEKLIKKLPIGFVYAVYLVFASFQKHITSIEIPWNGKTLDFSIIFQQDETVESKYEGLGLDSLSFVIAEAGTFGNRDQLNKTPFMDVFIKFYDITIKNLQEKERYDNNKRT